MSKDINVMSAIQTEREREASEQDLIPLDAEGIALAERKRFTLDINEIKQDPLR